MKTLSVSTLVLSASAVALAASVPSKGFRGCKMLFDGRVPQKVTPSDFDKNTSIFDHQFVHGESECPYVIAS